MAYLKESRLLRGKIKGKEGNVRKSSHNGEKRSKRTKSSARLTPGKLGLKES